MPSVAMSKPLYAKLSVWQKALTKSAAREGDVHPARLAKQIRAALDKVDVVDETPLK